jgi:hypothetical protein
MATWSNERTKQAQHDDSDNRAFTKRARAEAHKETLPDVPWHTDTGIEVQEISYEEFLKLTGYRPE